MLPAYIRVVHIKKLQELMRAGRTQGERLNTSTNAQDVYEMVKVRDSPNGIWFLATMDYGSRWIARVLDLETSVAAAAAVQPLSCPPNTPQGISTVQYGL